MLKNKKALFVLSTAILLSFAGQLVAGSASSVLDSLLAQPEAKRGLCVVLGDAEGKLALELARRSECLIFVQLEKESQVESVRKAVDKAGFYGSRVYVEQGGSQGISLADNLADAVLVVGESSPALKGDAMRVLRPGGRLISGDKTSVKPTPQGIDQWAHP